MGTADINEPDIRIYEWGVNVKQYEWLQWVDEHYGKLDEPFCKSVRFGNAWRPRILIRCKNPSTADLPLSDNPHGGSCFHLLSRRGLDVLRDLVEPACEILPLESALGEFWAVNCLVKADCIDLPKSRYRTYSNGMVAELYDWVFDPARLPPVHVFRVPESCVTFLVTQAFVERVREARLLGFRFNLLWSLKGGPIERQCAIRGTYIENVEPWELEAVGRLKAEMRRRRREAKAREHG